VFERASGPLRGVLPGSASGLLLGLLGDAEGLAAEGLVVEGLAAGAPPVAPVPAPVEPPAPPELPVPPELLCANAIPPDSSRVASTADVIFMAVSILRPSWEQTNGAATRSGRHHRRARDECAKAPFPGGKGALLQWPRTER
jgi:hypothetical protein